MNSLLFKIRAALGRRLGSSWIQRLLALKTEWRFAEIYGDFRFGQSLNKYAVRGLAKESGTIHGTVVKFLLDIPGPLSNLFLPGENNAVKPVYANLLKLDPTSIVTGGVLADMDVQWDFEQTSPGIGPFHCIVSQSMLEHLIDPYKHIRDCASMLKPDGYLIIHTVMPGFNYHRYPIDCVRFYPDWFEEVAKRVKLHVADRHIRSSRITYKLKKI